MSAIRIACAVLLLAFGMMILACGGAANNKNAPVQRAQPTEHARKGDAGAQPGIVNDDAADDNVKRVAKPSPVPTDRSEEHADQPLAADLTIEGWRFTTESGFVKVSGEVTNNTSRSLEAVEAVATFYTADGDFVKTSSALVDYNPILSGQTSPFTVLDTGNPQIATAKIAFKHLLGGTITAIERTKLVARQEAASKARDLRQQQREEELAAAERQRFLAAHAAEAPDAWKALDSRLTDGVTPELRAELRAFVEKYEGTAEAELADKELKAEAQLQLVNNYMKKGVREPAKKALQRLLQEYPDTHTAAQAKDAFKGLQ